MNTESQKIREFGKFRLDTGQKVLWHDGEVVAMPLKELEVLCLLVENRGRLVTKSELLDKIWADSFAEENNLSRHIYLLRKTLGSRGADKNLIENVPRRGYRFTGEVRDASANEIIVEKHTRTETLIEFEETGAEETEAGSEARAKTRLFWRPLFSAGAVLAVLLLGGIGFFGYQSWQGRAAAAEIKSIAVLPFKTLASGEENSHAGLGLADVLITRLGNIREVTVRPTSAVQNYKFEDSADFGKKLGVDAVLEGTIYRVGDKARVTARLVKVADGATVWSGQFEKLKADELQLQNEIALQVTGALALSLSGAEKNALTKNFTQDREAFELYQKGRIEWNKRHWQGMINAQQLFRAAIARDPNFTLAYAGLADTLATTTDPIEARSLVEKAIALDPNLAEPYASLGFLQTFHYRQWREAEASFKRSLELNPNYGTAHHWYAELLTIEGRHEEAKAAMRRALEIDPFSHNFLADLGQIYYFNREYAEAERLCLEALEIYPDFYFAYLYLRDIYIKTGEYEKSVEASIKAQKINLTFDHQTEEQKRALEADFERQRNVYRAGGIKKYLEISIGDATDPGARYGYATRYALLGEKEKALDLLEKSFDGKPFVGVFVKADPVFEDFRNEPRYREILRKMNLPL